MRFWLLVSTIVALASVGVRAASPPLRVVSLNPCYDRWLPQVLNQNDTVIDTSAHGNRLEAIIRARPDAVVHNNFISPLLLNALQRSAQQHEFELVALRQPQTWAEWQQQVEQLGQQLQRQESTQLWFAAQQQRLLQLQNQLPPHVAILMPNYFMWAADSWVADLLAQVDSTLVTPIKQGQLGQVRLAEILRTDTDFLVLEGFSSHYSRGQDWLLHSAFRRWLAGRVVHQVSGTVASCPATQAIHYLEAMQRES